jgi:hypothetical protein
MRSAVLLLLLGACSSDDEAARLNERLGEIESRIDRLEQSKEEPQPVEAKTVSTRAAEEAEDRATDAWEPLPPLDESAPPPEAETVVLTMDSASLRFHGRPVTLDELRELLKRRVDAGTKVSVVLRASGDVSTSRVNEVVQLARALGIAHIARAQTE